MTVGSPTTHPGDPGAARATAKRHTVLGEPAGGSLKPRDRVVGGPLTVDLVGTARNGEPFDERGVEFSAHDENGRYPSAMVRHLLEGEEVLPRLSEGS